MNRSTKCIPLALGATALAVLLFSVACGTTSTSASRVTEMRVVHLSPDTANLDLLIDNKVVFSDLAYGAPTPFSSITAVKHDLKLNLSGAPTNILDSPQEAFVGNTSYTYLIVGLSSSSGGIRANKLTDDHTAATDKGNFKLRVVNGSPTAGPVDVYIVAPGTSFTGATPVKATIGGLAEVSAADYQSLASGSYDIYITPAGDQTCLTNPKQQPPPLPPLISCFVNLDGRNNTGVPSFQAGQNRTLIMLDQVTTFGAYTTLPMLADLN